jgi:hypothetical protein
MSAILPHQEITASREKCRENSKFMAPDVVRALVEERQPIELTTTRLRG